MVCSAILHLVRSLNLLQATALNMSNMVGVGPFLTIPLIIASMNGPQCMLGWVLGTLLALCDGLVWAELAAAMPGSGGTFVYLREAFRGTPLARVMPFLFVWQFILSGPLEIASGLIGVAQYVSYFWRGMGPIETKLVVIATGLVAIGMLYRGISGVGRLTLVLWAGMMATVIAVVGTGLLKFHARIAFDFPSGAFEFSRGFFLGLGSALLIAMYDFLGYYDICYVAGEVREPGRILPKAIMISVVAVAVIYAAMNLSIIGVVPWREAMQSKFIASDFMERAWGPWAGGAITLMILWTAMASVFALLLGYSRVPYAAAVEGYFFAPFGWLHPSGAFPHVSLAVIGLLSIAAGMFSLEAVLPALITARILVQFIGQIGALHWLRTRRPEIERPFRMWLYPLPSLVALAGWSFVYLTSGWTYVIYGLGVVASGVVAFAAWSRRSA